MLAIIIPVKQSWIKPDCFFRLFLNLYRLQRLQKITQIHFKILIADTSQILAKNIIFLIVKLLCCQYLYIKSQNAYYTPAKIKNIAAEYSFNFNLFSF